MQIPFQLTLNFLTPTQGQPPQRVRGRAFPTQRCGARDLRPGAVLYPAVRRGALQTARTALRLPPPPGAGGTPRLGASLRSLFRPPPPPDSERRRASARGRRIPAHDPTRPFGTAAGLQGRGPGSTLHKVSPHPSTAPLPPALRALTSLLKHRKAPGTWSSGVDVAVPVPGASGNLGT